MIKSKYNLGDTIPGTIGKVVGKTFNSDNRWVYTIQFANGFLNVVEDDIQESIINVSKKGKDDG